MAASLADDTFKCKFVNENVLILIKISLKFVPTGPIDNIPALVQIMAWGRPCDKPLYEPMMVISLTLPQWFNDLTHWSLGALNRILDNVIFKLILVIDGLGIYCEISLRWMTQDIVVDKTIVVQVTEWGL